MITTGMILKRQFIQAKPKGNPVSKIASYAVLFTSCLFASSIAMAETPNLNPGLWSHTTITTVEGPVSLSPQTAINEECLTQAQIDEGINMLDVPKSCSITNVKILRDTADFAVSCNIQGLKNDFVGNAAFHGDNMNGKMSSQMESPIGTMVMKMTFDAKRVGACPAAK